VVGVGLEHGPRTLALSADHAAHLAGGGERVWGWRRRRGRNEEG
jgi:hypothetical protein